MYIKEAFRRSICIILHVNVDERSRENGIVFKALL